MKQAGIVGGVVADFREPANRTAVQQIWSIVWPAPMSRSSGGRSAVRTINGTEERSASATAGWKLAAAVPEVQTSTTGVPEACAAPRA